MEQIYLKLKEHGIDIDGVTQRLGGNRSLYLSICRKFVDDTTYPLIKQAIAVGDYSEAMIQLHTLKGVAANLGFIYLYALCNHLLDSLKQKDMKYFEMDIHKLCQECDLLISILT